MRADAAVQLATMLGAPKINSRRTYVQIPCPLAPQTHEKGTDKHPSLSILVSDVERSGWKCHACGEKGALSLLVTKWATITRKDPGPLYDFIQKEEEGVEAIHTRIDTRLEARWSNGGFFADNVDWEAFSEEELDSFIGKVPEWALDKVTLATCKEWKLGYDPDWKDPDTGENWPRITIPIRRRDGGLVGLFGRALNDDCPNKYWNYWHFIKTNYLFGMDRIKEKDAILVVEGMFDVMKLWEFGLPVLGLMGSEPSERQAQMLLDYKRVLLALDRDKAGEKGTDWLVRRLLNRVPVFAVPFPDGKTDPKHFTKEEAHHAFENPRRIF